MLLLKIGQIALTTLLHLADDVSFKSGKDLEN